MALRCFSLLGQEEEQLLILAGLEGLQRNDSVNPDFSFSWIACVSVTCGSLRKRPVTVETETGNNPPDLLLYYKM